MGTKTTRLDLLKPSENDYYNQQTEQADNWQKVDDYAVYTDRDKNAIWGGLDGGGFIQDPAITKIPGKRYIDNVDNKAYICNIGRGTSDIGTNANINTTQNYAACNAVDNLDKLLNLNIVLSETVVLGTSIQAGTVVTKNLYIPQGYKLSSFVVSARVYTDNISQQNYRLKHTPISYSVDQSGLCRISNTENIDTDSRCVDILYVVTRMV